MAISLNASQIEAVPYVDGPLLVLAGAGSGKTRVITQKIIHLVGACGYAPKHVAAITFTNRGPFRWHSYPKRGMNTRRG